MWSSVATNPVVSLNCRITVTKEPARPVTTANDFTTCLHTGIGLNALDLFFIENKILSNDAGVFVSLHCNLNKVFKNSNHLNEKTVQFYLTS